MVGLRGQLSVEMLILVALVLGLVFIVYTSMTNSAQKAADTVSANTDTVLRASTKCLSDDDCTKVDKSWSCNTKTNSCK